MIPRSILVRVMPILASLLLVGVIELGVAYGGVPEYLFPPPSQVAIELWNNLPSYLPHLLLTVIEAMIGFLVGNVLAAVFALGFSQVTMLRIGIYPLVIGFQAIPILAIAPFVAIWFGTDILGKSVVAALICYFPATVIMTDALTNLNKDALKFLSSLGANRGDVFRYLALPSSVPASLAALQVSSTLCFVGAIVAEISGSESGIGFLILKASYEYQTKTLFAVLVLVSVVTLAFFLVVRTASTRLTRRFSLRYANTDT